MSDSNIALLIPAYRAADFLPRLLRSAQAQTVPFSEIRVYDDCSPDNTAEVAEDFGALVTRGTHNQGCPCGKNALARLSRCDWVHFHDADDELKPDFVEKALPWTREPRRAEVVLFSYDCRSHETGQDLGQRIFDKTALETEPLAYALKEQINPFCGLYHRESFLSAGGWDEDTRVLYAEDQAGHLRLALAGLRFSADPGCTVINHLRQGSMSSGNLAKANRATLELMKNALNEQRADQLRHIIGLRLWKTAGCAAGFLDWPTAYEAAALAQQTGAALPEETGLLFRLLKPLNLRIALHTREQLIRWFKPSLRRAPIYHPAKKSP